MAIKDSDVEAYLKTVRVEIDASERYVLVMQQLCYCLSSIHEILPEVGRRAHHLAKAYWIHRTGTTHDLQLIRAQCWQYLNEINASIELSSPSVIATRAVICTLYAEPLNDDLDGTETLFWFVTLLNKLGDYSAIFNVGYAPVSVRNSVFKV